MKHGSKQSLLNAPPHKTHSRNQFYMKRNFLSRKDIERKRNFDNEQVPNFRKLTRDHPNLDLVNINA